MEKLKNSSMLTDVILLILGIVILLNPWGTMETLVKFAGLILIIAGIVGIVTAIMGGKFNAANISSMVGYVGALIAGIIFMTRPWMIIGPLHLVFGAIIVVHGIINLIRALNMGKPAMWVPLALAVIAIVAGVLVFTGVLTKVLIQVIGVVLIFNAANSLYMSLTSD